MNWKLIWSMIRSLSTWAHLAGAFMLTTVAMHFTDPQTAAIGIVIGSIALEAYQAQCEPDYPTKRLDTALDLIADGVGITLAVML